MSETPGTDQDLQRVTEAWEIALEGPDQPHRADHAESTIEPPKKRRNPASDRADVVDSDAEHEGLLFELGEDDDDRDPG